MLIVVIYLLAGILNKLSLSRNIRINEEKSQNSLFPLRLCASVATISILFTFTNCGIFGGGKTKGDAPWLLLASGVNGNTLSFQKTILSFWCWHSTGFGFSKPMIAVTSYILIDWIPQIRRKEFSDRNKFINSI